MRYQKMRARVFIIVVFALAVMLSAQFVNTSSASPGYSARLISPTAGQVLYPGQIVRVEWRSQLPKIDLRYLRSCESEVWLSLDGGRTFTAWISPWMDAKTQYFNWTVPNTPTNAAVLDIRFGCDPVYPESFAPQPGSTFVIAKPGS
jgi:hypothetical protein